MSAEFFILKVNGLDSTGYACLISILVYKFRLESRYASYRDTSRTELYEEAGIGEWQSPARCDPSGPHGFFSVFSPLLLLLH